MSPELIFFAQSYRRLLRAFSLWVAFAPRGWRPAFIFALGRRFSPFQLHHNKICRSMRLVLPDGLVDATWRHWLDSHIRFVLDFLSYGALDEAWLKQTVLVEEPALVKSLRDSGGLLLTYHTHHQNTMCCALGLHDIKISAIASLPESSPLFEFIGPWAQRVNFDSARHFGGGTYIFTDNLRNLLHATRRLLANREVVVCLCDFHQPRPGLRASGRLFNRSISPPTGAIEIAIRQGAPIFTAIFAPQNGKLVLQMRRLDQSGGLEAIVAGYFSFLESSILRSPACWQGWEWFEDLPFAEQATT